MKRIVKTMMIVMIAIIMSTLGMVRAQDPATTDTIFEMQAGEVRIFYLPNDGSTITLQVAINSEAWFSVFKTEGVNVVSQAMTANGDPIPLDISVDPSGGSQYHATVSEPAQVNIEIVVAPESVAGYLRVEYGIAPLDLTRPATQLSFLGDPMQLIFNESFTDNQRNWWTGQTNFATGAVVDNRYQVAFLSAGQLLTGVDALPGTHAPQFMLSVGLSFEANMADSVAGFIFRMIDGQNFYVWQVDPQQGAWRVLSLVNGAWVTTLDWQMDARLVDLAGEYKLAVWVLGDVYIFFWDGVPLGHISDATHQTGGVGFYAEVAPNGSGQPLYRWDSLQVQVEPDDITWGITALPRSVVLPSPEVVAAPATLTLTERLLGVWFWVDDTQQVQFVFEADGSFVQTITRDEAIVQTGTWSVINDAELVIEFDGLPTQNYTPSFSDSNEVMLIPQLGNRVFVRVSSE